MTATGFAADAGIPVRAFPRRFVVPLYVGCALNPVNSSAIATGLVAIAAAMGVTVGRTSILVSVLYLTSAIAQPTAGKLAEEFGPRRVFVVGIVAVLAGGVLGGLAPGFGTLILARVLIGAGTSAAYPSAMVLIRRRATDAGLDGPPGGVLGGISIAGQATVAIGPTVGGLLIGWFDWRAAFLLNVPIALGALAMAVRWLPADPPASGPTRTRDLAGRIDLAGIAGFAATLSCLLAFLISLPDPDWALLAVALVAAAGLVAWELRARAPFLDLRLLATNHALARTYLRSGLTLLGTYTVLYGLTQWIEEGRGLSAGQAGLVLVPMGALSALITRPVARRNLVRGPLIVSAVLMLAGGAATLLLTRHSPVLAIIGITALFGLATGGTSVANQTALYAQAPAATLGTAAGLLRTSGYIGSIASATITGFVYRTHVGDHGLHVLAGLLLGIGAVVLLLTVADRRL